MILFLFIGLMVLNVSACKSGCCKKYKRDIINDNEQEDQLIMKGDTFDN
jgi:hypothetical protein